MIVDNNVIRPSDPQNLLRRVYDKQVVGKEYWLGYIYYRNGQKLPEPYLETSFDFEEVTIDQLKNEYAKQYGELVDKYIREKYTLSDELAIQRQRDEKPDSFQEYFNYCEACKVRAQEDLGLIWPEPNEINISNNE